MNYHVYIDLESPTFDKDPRPEIARILRGIADKLDKLEDAPLVLIDSNGNKVGVARTEGN